MAQCSSAHLQKILLLPLLPSSSSSFTFDFSSSSISSCYSSSSFSSPPWSADQWGLSVFAEGFSLLKSKGGMRLLKCRIAAETRPLAYLYARPIRACFGWIIPIILGLYPNAASSIKKLMLVKFWWYFVATYQSRTLCARFKSSFTKLYCLILY